LEIVEKHISRRSAQRVIGEEKSNTTKAALIKAFKVHRPYEDIIQHVRDTQYQGSISKFVNDRLFSSLSKKDISTLANSKESAMILGHWDSDPFDNYKPKRHDNRRNSGSNLLHQNHYYQDIVTITI